MLLRFAGCILLFVIARCASATTWDEPWQEDVIKKAESFAKIKVLRTTDSSATIAVTRTVAGVPLPPQCMLSGCYVLRLTTFSEELELPLDSGKEYYVFVAKVGNIYGLPTPTSGFGIVEKGKVKATYRHSYHQAIVDEDLYVKTMSCIFHKLHDEPFDTLYMDSFMRVQLHEAPAGPAQDFATFSKQHAALECFYYFGNKRDEAVLEPFLKSQEYHVQISAVRALSRIDSKSARERLFQFLTNDNSGFARVMAVWGLKRLEAKEYLPRLQAFVKSAPTEETGFGGNIMDPRVGTRFPSSVKDAVEELIAEWS